jgi:hypothetical protein
MLSEAKWRRGANELKAGLEFEMAPVGATYW